MKFGVCTWIFGDESLPEIARRVSNMGFDGIELFGDVALNVRDVQKALSDWQLAVLSLTPANVDLCHPEPEISRAALDYYYRLVDFAGELGAPLVCCHGMVGRVRAVGPYEQEWDRMVEAVRAIAARGAERGLRVAVELLNRYEAHLLNTAEEGLRFLREVGAPNVGLLLDAYHMNIEEARPAQAIAAAGSDLFLFHAADSNRQAVGRGHTDFHALARALHGIGYRGDIVFECVAPGPDPFAPIKGPQSREQVGMFLRESLERMKEYFGSGAGS